MQIRLGWEAATSLTRGLRCADDAARSAVNKERGSCEGRLVAAKIATSSGCNMIAHLLLFSGLNLKIESLKKTEILKRSKKAHNKAPVSE